MAASVLHGFLWVLAPLNLALLWFTYRRHRDPRPLAIGGMGALFITAVMVLHAVHNITDLGNWPHDPLIWTGLALLGVGILLDWRAGRRKIPGTVRV